MDEFLEAQQEVSKPGTLGWWESVLPELDAERLGSLLEAARSPRISHRTISTVLGRWGYQVTPGQVGHWRRNNVR